MSEVIVKPIEQTPAELRKYVKFGIDLYRGNDCHVPPLIFDEVNTLNPKKNPAFDFCDARSFMAWRDGKPAGRITAIINHEGNRRTGEKVVRFGFADFIDDDEVVDKLFDAAISWGREQGMEKIVGPMGFSDMDHEGMLIEGFDELGTIATIYNYPYYQKQIERLGFKPEADWVEYRMTVPEAIPDKYSRIADIVQRKYELHVPEIKSRKWLKDNYGQAIFDLINEAYDKLYGYVPLTDRQIQYYIDMYLGIIRLDTVAIILDKDDRLVGVGITLPSLSRALQRSHGRMFPLGWFHLLRAIYGHNDIVDLMLVAVKPEYQSKGVNSLLFAHLLPKYIRNGFKWAESNPELADNSSVQLQWQYFEQRQHRRRRAYSRSI